MPLEGIDALTLAHRHAPTNKIHGFDPRVSVVCARKPVEQTIAGGDKRVAGRGWHDGQQFAHQSDHNRLGPAQAETKLDRPMLQD